MSKVMYLISQRRLIPGTKKQTIFVLDKDLKIIKAEAVRENKCFKTKALAEKNAELLRKKQKRQQKFFGETFIPGEIELVEVHFSA